MAQRSNRSVRRILERVRLNVTTTIILLVTLSVGVLGLIIWTTSGQTLVNQQLAQQVVEQESLSLDSNASALSVATAVQDELRLRIRRNIVLYTPVVIIVSGVVAYVAARRILRPIREGQKMQQRFIQDAAHELRNPLAAVKATIQSLRARKNPSSTDITATLDSVERQLGQLIDINENLLFLGEARTTTSTDTTLSDLLHDVIEDLYPIAHDKGIELRTAIADNVNYRMEVDDFVQLTRNLIENAIKYTPQDGKPIDVVLTQTNYRIRFKVKDHGQGIPESEVAMITQRFYRASNAREQEGSGLGMSIVQKIVKTYGGNLDVRPREPSGTIVTVTL